MNYRWKTIKQKILPRSLYGRSLMIIVMPIFVMQVIVGYIFINRHWESINDNLVYSLAGDIRASVDQIKQSRTPEDLAHAITQVNENFDLRTSIEKPQAVRTPLRKLQGWQWYDVKDKLQRALERKLSEPFTLTDQSAKDRWFEVNVTLGPDRVIVFRCYNKQIVSPTTYIFLLWLVGSSIVLMAVAVLFMRNQVRPIHRLAIAAEKIGKGQDLANFKIEGAREVRQAARAFLDMRDRIRRQIDQRTAMLAGVSHDLRTPLTRMKLQLAMMKKSTENDNLLQDLEDMEKMLEGYLTFARGDGNEQTETIDLKALLERIVSNARRQGYNIETDYAGGPMLRVRPLAIERAIGNIVSNACKYAKHVWVSLKEEPEEAVEIFVDDDGPGIPAAQREEVFKPFYRLEKSRNPKTGGVGLGLSIAQDIIHGHGGEILLEQSPRGGLRVVIRLPA